MHELWIAGALFASFVSAALAGAKEEALQVLEKWTQAFTACDVVGIVRPYSPDVLFFRISQREQAWQIVHLHLP